MRPAREWRRRKSPLLVPLILAAGLGMVLATPSAGTTRAQLVLEVTSQLSNSPTRESRNPRVVVTRGGTVFVAWEEEGATQAGLNDVFFRNLPAGVGATWQPPVAAAAARFAQSPALATYAGDEVGLAFESVYPVAGGRQIELKQWNPTARRWPLVPNALGGVGEDGVEPDLAYQPDGTLWMTWVNTRDGSRRPYYARLVNGGVESGGTILACFSFDAFWPRIAVAADQDTTEAVHVVWSNDHFAAGASIQHAFRSLGETEWTCNDAEPTFFETDPVQQRLPDVSATARDSVCIAWQEGDGPLGPNQKQDIIHTCAPWSQVSNTSDSGARAVAPNIALAPNALGIGALIMWELQQAGQVWFSRSTPPLKAPVRSNSHTPDIALDPVTGTVHAVWSEDVGEGGSEIFYARWSALPPSTTPTATATRTPSPTASGSATAATPVATTATATLTATLSTPGRTPTPSATLEITPTPLDGTAASATPTGTASQASATSPTPVETDTPVVTATPRGMKIYLAIAHRAPPSPE
jgi:hypothetical protein